MHSNTRLRTPPYVPLAALYLTVGLLAVVGRLGIETGLLDILPRLRWTTIHLVTIGAMAQALFGTLPHLVGTVGDADVRLSPRSRWAQWLGLNAGFPIILLGMTTGENPLAAAGATIVLAALASLLWSVFRVSGAATRDSPILSYYRAAPWYFVLGILAAFGMLLNLHGPGGYFGSIEAHVHANVWGFLALVVAGTLTSVVPEITGAELPSERWQTWSFWAIAIGALGLVSGPWLAINAFTMGGLAIYVVGTVGLLANLVRSARATCKKDPRFAHVIGAYVWLVFPVPFAPFVLLFPDMVPGGPIEIAAINGLVFGWMLQLAMAFLPALVEAVARGGERFIDLPAAVGRSTVRPSRVGLVTVNLGMLALWLKALPLLGSFDDGLTLLGYTLVAVAWAVFVVGLWRTIVGVDVTPPGEAQSTTPTVDPADD